MEVPHTITVTQTGVIITVMTTEAPTTIVVTEALPTPLQVGNLVPPVPLLLLQVLRLLVDVEKTFTHISIKDTICNYYYILYKLLYLLCTSKSQRVVLDTKPDPIHSMVNGFVNRIYDSPFTFP